MTLTTKQLAASITGDVHVVGGDSLTGYNDNIHQPLLAPYSELSYFEGYHFHHIATYQEHLRIKRLNKQAAAAHEERCRQARLYAFYSSN